MTEAGSRGTKSGRSSGGSAGEDRVKGTWASGDLGGEGRRDLGRRPLRLAGDKD